MTMTGIKPQYEMPQKITFGGLPRRTDVYDQVFETYCPIVPLDSLSPAKKAMLDYDKIERTRVHKACAESKEREDGICPHFESIDIPDPDVLYVGRFLDGLVDLQVFESRKLAKNLINNIPAGATFRQPGISGQFTGGGKVNMWFKAAEPRAEMYEALAKGQFSGQPEVETLIRNGEAPTIAIGTIIKDAEPGEIINSPTVVDVPPGEEVDMWEAGLTESSWKPKIRLDRRYGLHYLKRGDEITISGAGWPKPRVQPFEHKWVLKPRSEGRSLVQQDAGGNDVIQLSSMRA
jgi:hypothetical protein|tara:strand:- start:337 stop:1209 length:873 start_codon:yes stop_codon:yes gene_type:complete